MGFLTVKNKLLSSYFLVKLLESFFGRGSYLLFTLLFSFVCTRLYGAEIFGVYTYAFTLAQILMVLAKAGLNSGLMYSIPKNEHKHVSLSFVTNFIISAIIIILTWIIVDDIYIKIMIPLIWLISAEQLFFGLYRAEGKIKEYYFINGFITMVLRVILIVALYYLTGKNEYSIGIGVFLSFIFSNVMYFIRHRYKFKKILFDKIYLKYSFTLVVATMMGTLINKVDIMMLGNMTTSLDVGIYQITVQVSNILSSLLLIFNTVFAPEISKLFHNNKRVELKKLYIKATRILTFFSFFLVLVLIFGSNFILMIFGSEFTNGQNALILRSIGQFISVSVGGVWLMLSMTGEPKFQMYANLVACFVNVVLNFILIPIYGIGGAALASMVTIILTNVAGYFVVSKRFGVKVFGFI